MLLVASLTIVGATGLFLVILGIAALVLPAQTTRFFMGFGTSAYKHYAELTIRLLIAGALLVAAPHIPYTVLVSGFGWLMLVTTIGLLFVPWHWHRRFIQQAVPRAMRFLPVVGAVSLTGGVLIMWVVFLAKMTPT